MTLEAVQVEKRFLSVADYHKMIAAGIPDENDRVELIYGKIIKRGPIYSFHSSRVKRTAAYFFNNLPQKKVNIGIQDPITLVAENSEPEPDLFIADYREDFYLTQHPTPNDIHLVVEVSNSTLKYDRIVKAKLYAAVDIPVYWIVNVEENQIEVYSQPENGKYTATKIYKKGEKFRFEKFALDIETDDLLG